MKIYEGNILTIDQDNHVYHYIVEDKGIILYVGNELPEEYKDIKSINLGDRALCPSFCDTHQHFASFALFHSGLNVMNATSNVEVMSMIKEYVKGKNNKLFIAFGASPYSVKEHKLVSRIEIDTVCPDVPFVVIKYDGHACIVNTAFLNKYNNKISHERGYHFHTGEMNQEAFFKVSDIISASISLPTLIKNMQNAIDYEVSNGIGMIHSVSGVGFPFNIDISLEKIFAKTLMNGVNMRIFPQSMDTRVASRRHIKRIGGCFKCALDGCFGSADAKLNEPYLGSDNDGVLYYTDEQVIEFCKKANRKGLQIEMHAIGDKAFDQATRALKEALDDFPRNDHRHGIIHDCLPTIEGIKICEEYHIQMLVQTSFINWRQEPDEYLVSILGKERVNRLNPLRTFMDHHIMIAAGSDGPCTDPNPIDWIYKAVNHSNKDEALTVAEALRVCTYNGYYALFDEDKRGSLEAGKIADMVILDKNPLSVKKEELKDIKVLDTILGGVSYRKQHQSFAKILLKSMFKGNEF